MEIIPRVWEWKMYCNSATELFSFLFNEMTKKSHNYVSAGIIYDDHHLPV